MKSPITLPRMLPMNPSLAIFVSVLFGITGNSMFAASVVWGPATNVLGNNDVRTNGTLHGAVNTGGANTTVNGVTFTGWAPTGVSVTDPSGKFNLTAAAGYGVFSNNLFGSASAPFSNLTAPYQALLDSADFASNPGQTDFTGAITMTINGLTFGTLYEFQWWTNDPRPFSTGPVTATTGLTSVSLDPNTTNSAGGTGQFAIGTFIADSTSQVITFSTTGNGNLQNAFQVRVIPEPSGMALLATGFIFAAAFCKRRKCA